MWGGGCPFGIFTQYFPSNMNTAKRNEILKNIRSVSSIDNMNHKQTDNTSKQAYLYACIYIYIAFDLRFHRWA